MILKLDYVGYCSVCNEPVKEEDIGDAENETCLKCHDKILAEAEAYWRPLYDGEKLAGLLPNKEPS